MKTISIAELHEHTDEWIRQATQLGEIVITDGGEPVATIQPLRQLAEPGSFGSRRLLPEFVALGLKPSGGSDVTELISEDRDRDGL